MPRPIPLPGRRPLATLTLAFAAIATPAAPSQAGPIRDHYARWYGQDFYDHQRNGLFVNGIHRQYDGGYYGPAMIYGRQYADEYHPPRDQAFHPAPQKRRDLYGIGEFGR